MSPAQTYDPDWSVGRTASAYTAPQPQPQPVPQPQSPPSHVQPQQSYAQPEQSYAQPRPHPQQPYGQAQMPRTSYDAAYAPAAPAEPAAPPSSEETVALRIADLGARTGPEGPSTPAAGSRAVPEGPGAPGGRAARRKASKRHGKHGGSDAGETHGRQPAADTAAAPVSRAAARRAAKARKPGAAVMASRAIGEVFITTGVLMLLFVTYQLYWTNIRAHAQADSEASSLQDDWAKGKGNPGTFEPGQGFALLHIPKLDVVVPIAEGTDKKRVLDRGMVGHYAEEGVKTAMPDAEKGNFGLAGHRNTHGEPFRYINRLKPGDPIVVETQNKYFVYKMSSILPVTPPSNTAVLDAIPKGSGFKAAGRYITLTTCTPEFTSKYRMIVWGTMVEERPRDKGKPQALVG
ncbi:class E sortase [Streptomyces apricus]